MNKNLRIYLLILTYIADIEDAFELKNCKTKADFIKDRQAQLITSMSIINMYSAYENMDEEVKDQFDMNFIRTARNIAAHNYEAVDFGIVWDKIIMRLETVERFCLQEVNQKYHGKKYLEE